MDPEIKQLTGTPYENSVDEPLPDTIPETWPDATDDDHDLPF